MFGEFCSIFTKQSCWALIPLSYIIYRITRTFVAFLQAILIYYIAPIFYAPNFEKIKYRWTAISGGTDGIGKAYMFELAQRGVRKFLLIGRNEEKLEKVKNEMESMHPGSRVVTINFDFSKAIETESSDKLRKQLEKIDIGLAVNSVGVGREFLERFGDRPEVDRHIFKVNAFGAAEFISAILPSMEWNGGGQFVVISSSQGFRPIPLLAAYSATKSFISFISEAVDREYAKFNIRVQCLTPALVATNMTYYKKSSLFVVSPEKFAHEAVGTLGLIRMTSGCFNHEIQMLLRHLFPWTILKHLIMPIYWHHQKRMIRLHGANESSMKLNNNDEMSSVEYSLTAPKSPKHSKIPTFCGNGSGIRHRA